MDYFYSPPRKITAESVLIDGEEFLHLTHVMRKKEGDEVRVVDGKGTAFDVVLGKIGRKEVRGRILASYRGHNEPGVALTIAAAVLKNPSKFDFLVEKTTELGAGAIIPLRTDRTIPSHARVDRWQKLAVAAMKQSCRSVLPEVRELTALSDLLRESEAYDCKFIAHEKKVGGGASLLPRLKGCRSIIVLIGPEGGFSDAEVEQSTTAGYVPVYLGERRLRTETAAVALAAAVCLGRDKRG